MSYKVLELRKMNEDFDYKAEFERTGNKKYVLDTDDTKEVKGHTLYRIIYKDGSKGGYIERYDNLSQDGDCGIYDDSCVFGNAAVKDSAIVEDKAQVFGNAEVSGNACVFDNAKVYGHAKVNGHAIMRDKSEAMGYALVTGSSKITGKTRLF